MFFLLLISTHSDIIWERFENKDNEINYSPPNNLDSRGIIIINCSKFTISFSKENIFSINIIIVENSSVSIPETNIVYSNLVFSDSFLKGPIKTKKLFIPDQYITDKYSIQYSELFCNSQCLVTNLPMGKYENIFLINPELYIADTPNGVSLKSENYSVEITNCNINLTSLSRIRTYGSVNKNINIKTSLLADLFTDDKNKSGLIKTREIKYINVDVVEIDGEKYIKHNLDSNNRTQIITDSYDCIDYLTMYRPYPLYVDIDGINASVNSACNGTTFIYYISSNLENSNVVYITMSQALFILIGFLIFIIASLIPLFLIVYRSYKKGTLIKECSESSSGSDS